MSLSALSLALYEADDTQKFYDPAFLSKIERGDARAPTRLMLLLGEVLDPGIDELPEYHLAMMRRALDEREVGLDQALANLQRLDTAVQADEDAESLSAYLTAQGETLKAALASPSEEDRPANGATSARRRKGQASS